MKPLFSIICPIYNSELFLKECADSIINQTYSNWELILVDDGSTDNSINICKRLEKQKKNIKFYSSIHKGPFNARSIGIKYARGKYILFIDSDDYLDLNALEIIYKNLNDFNYPDLVTFCFSFIDKNGKKKKIINNYNLRYNVIIKDLKTMFEFCVFPHDLPSLCLKVLKKELVIKGLQQCLKQIGYKKLINAKYREDYILSFFFIINCKSLLMLNKYIYNYRINFSSTTHNLSKRDFEDAYFFEKIVYRFAVYKKLLTQENLILFEQKICNVICSIIKYCFCMKYKSFKYFIINIRNDNFFNNIFEHWQNYDFLKNKVVFQLLQKRRFFLLWVFVNLNFFRLLIFKRINLKH